MELGYINGAILIVNSEIALRLLSSVIEAISKGNSCLGSTRTTAAALRNSAIDLLLKLHILNRSHSDNDLSLCLWLIFKSSSNQADLHLMLDLSLRLLSDTLILIVTRCTNLVWQFERE